MTQSFLIRPMSMALLLLLGGIRLSSLHAQPTTDSLQAAQLLSGANSLLAEQRYADASTQALEAAAAFGQIKDWDNWLQAYRVILNLGYYSRDYSSSIPLLEAAKELLPQDQTITRAKLDYYLGYAYNNIGDVYASLRAYEAGAPVFKTARDTSWLISLYGNLIAAYTQTGDYTQAIDYANTAARWSQHSTDTMTRWRNLRMLGRAYFFKHELDNAARSYQQAQQLYDPEDGIFEFYQAEIAVTQGRIKRARRFCRKAIRMAKEEPEDQLRFHKLLGEIELEAGRFAIANQLFLKILPDYQKYPNRRLLGQLYINIARAMLGLKQYDTSLTYYQQAVHTFFPEFKAKSFEANPTPGQWSREVWMVEVFRGKGKCFLGKYQIQQEERWLQQAERHFQLAIDYIEELKMSFNETDAKLWFSSNTHSFYEDLLASKFQRYELGASREHFDAAFQTAQRAHAFVLRELLNEQQALQIAGVEEDTLELLRQYNTNIVLLDQQLEGPPNRRLDSLQQVLFETKLQRQQLKDRIITAHPRFAQLRNDLQTIKAQELQEQLEEDQLVLKYFLGEKNLYIFSIAAQDFAIDTILLPPQFESLIGQYRKSLGDLDFIKDSMAIAEAQFLSAAHQLYTILLHKPLRRYQQSSLPKRITIIADGLLNSIPFQALMPDKSDDWTRAEDFVIARHAINYAYFCKMLLDRPSNNTSPDGFVSFGLEFDDHTLQHLQKIAKDSIKNKIIRENLRSGSLTKLPFSDDEARELAQLMKGQSWLNEEATKTNFLNHTVNAQVIHMATHSILDTESPNRSSLVFTKPPNSSDHLLRLDEIYNLRFDADLIVLSACNTGSGIYDKGEGINSLARAFNFSGIPAVTATLWNITDESTRHLMNLYYGYLQAGHENDVALQKAQLEYLSNDEVSSPAFRLPVYWAAWMPIGETQPINTGNAYLFPTILLLVLILGGLFWIFSRRTGV